MSQGEDKKSELERQKMEEKSREQDGAIVSLRNSIKIKGNEKYVNVNIFTTYSLSTVWLARWWPVCP